MGKEKPKFTKHPDAIAWDEWFAGREGIADATTLGTTARASEYLLNRLEVAWQAGVEYGRSTRNQGAADAGGE